MERKIFHRLASVEEALAILEEHVELAPRGVEVVGLDEALGRVLAEDVVAPIDYPPFDRSEVDGYAVKVGDVAWADELSPASLEVVGASRVGSMPSIEVGARQAVEVQTGAPIPRGAEAVLMEEYVEREGNALRAYRSVHPLENVAVAGGDIARGDPVLFRGVLLTPESIGVLAGLGIREVRVYVRPRVAIFSTGDEIAEPGRQLPEGKVYDSNGPMLVALARSMGASADYLGILPDDEDAVANALGKALEHYDLVLTSGGTSAGERDVVYRAFERLGPPGIVVHGLRVRPGKPTVVAVARGKPLIGLPGFPFSSYSIFAMLVAPILARLAGLRAEMAGRRVRARLALSVKKEVGKEHFLPVMLRESEGEVVAYPLHVSSGSLSVHLYADGVAVLPANVELVGEGSEVEVRVLGSGRAAPALNVVGSNDPLLYFYLEDLGLLSVARVVPVGSLGGWIAVARGFADVAPTHILDEATLTYNRHMLRELGLVGRAVLVKGYRRLVGILVRRGNPKGVRGIEDFLRGDVRIVNRPRGTGIRALVDMLLRKAARERGLGEDLGKIVNGYYYEMKTHNGVAMAIIQGRADAGVAVAYYARLYGLDLVPLAWEEFDFAVPRDRLAKRGVRKFVEGLKEELAETIKRRGLEDVYSVHEATGEVFE